MLRRIDKRNASGQSPMIIPESVKYELAEKQQAIACGGIGNMLELAKQLDLRKHINNAIPLFKFCAPYDEADHVLNMALNLLSGGTCLEHLELLRTDEAYLNAVGAQRIPDPTTAGDFCRRFSDGHILSLMQGFNRVRQVVWKQQPDEFFDEAIIEADGTMVETTGERKEGIGMNYKKQWGYHPLIVSLANTNEQLFIANRSGNRPSHEHAEFYFDLAIDHCRTAGFRKILLRGDTDFALTENFDRWDDDGVKFVFGYDAKPNLVKIAESLDESAWKPLRRRDKKKPKTDNERRRKPNYKEQVVVANGYKNKKLRGEEVTEFEYQPTACDRKYRMTVIRKDIEISEGEQQALFHETVYFFYITNETKTSKSSRQVVFAANDRCDQENLISHHKASGALTAPLDTLVSNWAYMVIASLAWSLKQWSGLIIQPDGTKEQKVEQQKTKRRIIRMEFRTFCQTLIQIPAQIIRRARQTVFRLLTYRPSLDALFLIRANIRSMRC
jgi:hypothetical protein